MRTPMLLSLAAALVACGSPTPEPTDTPDAAQEQPAVSEAAETETDEQPAAEPSLYALSATALDGSQVDFAQYAGHVTLVVNVASKCGYTPQYAGLQELYEELTPMGVTVLGFPSNDFGGQEPGSAEQIRQFCEGTYGVTFPMFDKVKTQAGNGQSPVYAFLGEQTGELPGWNFCKYLVGKDGKPVAFFKSNVAPNSDELRAAIMDAL